MPVREAKVTLEFTLNGRPVKVEPREDESLLETLRERCGVRSTKDGCSPQGQCGCCLAIVGGRAVMTCAMPASQGRGPGHPHPRGSRARPSARR